MGGGDLSALDSDHVDGQLSGRGRSCGGDVTVVDGEL